MMGLHGLGLVRSKYKDYDNMQGFREIFKMWGIRSTPVK